MLLIDIFNESVYFDVPSAVDDDKMIPIFSLDNPIDLRKALASTRRTSKGELRGMIADDLVIAWDSYKEVHAGVSEYLEQYDAEYGENVNQEWKALVYFYQDGVAMAPKREGDLSYVRNHPIVKQIYNGTVNIIIPRDGTN